jgi:hypothetical protein
MAWVANVTPYVKVANTGNPFAGATLNSTAETPVGGAPVQLANGTSANQINLGWADSRSIDNTGVTLDLTNLAATATNTGAATFTAIKGMKIINDAATNTLIIGNAASAQFTPGFSAATNTVTLQPGQSFMVTNHSAAGWDCTTNKNLKLVSGAATVAAKIILWGLD